MRHKVVAGIGLLVLLVLHLDFWRGERHAVLLGWLPEELAYRLVWILLAFLFLLYFCARVWVIPDEAE